MQAVDLVAAFQDFGALVVRNYWETTERTTCSPVPLLEQDVTPTAS